MSTCALCEELIYLFELGIDLFQGNYDHCLARRGILDSLRRILVPEPKLDEITI